MFWVDSELGSDIYLDGKQCRLVLQRVGIAYLCVVQYDVLQYNESFQKLLELHNLGFHILTFLDRDPVTCSDASVLRELFQFTKTSKNCVCFANRLVKELS